MTARVVIEARIPEALMEEFLQHLRAFDDSHAGCHLRILAQAEKEIATAEIAAIFDRLDPPLPVRAILPRGRCTHGDYPDTGFPCPICCPAE